MKGHIVMGATALVTYLGLADVPGSHLLAGITRLTQTRCFATGKESARFIISNGAYSGNTGGRINETTQPAKYSSYAQTANSLP